VEIYGEVIDTGIGIPYHLQDNLFKPFFQVDTNFGGTGLGLSICHQLASLMGGQISLNRSSSAGTVFSFTLPFTIKEPSPPIPPIGYQFLLVSPCQNTIECAQELGLSLGINFTGVLSMDALPNDRFDGIFIDSSLGDILSAQVKSLNASHKVLLLPAHQIDRGKEAINQGFDYFFTKPLRSQRLVQFLSKIQPKSTDRVVKNMSSSPAKKIRILLAEDNPANQLVARKLLEKIGYTIDIVSNGEEALKVWSNYDLILMDCQMPVMDGYTATKAIRAQQTPNQKVLIVAMTANAMESDRQYCLECGMDEYITKPISLERLRELFQWVWRKIEAF
jgi:CheY-like chemotaxis protein